MNFADEDMQYINEPFYQLLREKERLIREYKFKYESTKLLYDEIIETLVAQRPLISSVNQLADILSRLLGFIVEELESVNLKKSLLQKMTLKFQGKFEEILRGFQKPQTQSDQFTPHKVRLDASESRALHQSKAVSSYYDHPSMHEANQADFQSKLRSAST